MKIKNLISAFLLGVFLGVPGVWAAVPEPVSSGSLVIEGCKVHPCLALSPEDVLLGRKNYRNYDWAKRTGDGIIKAAGVWLDRDVKWIEDHMPGKGACFAYGFAGCPECGMKTVDGTSWASSRCSFDNPGHVKCAGGHVLPNDKYRDEGTGFRGKDGRIHYLVGTYNAWAVEMFIQGASDLAYAYALTGEEKYGKRCLDILDAVADIYPTCGIGSWDYPETKPGQNSGRLNRPFYQVGRVLITLSGAYDLVYNSGTLEGASVREGFTRKENIEKNMLLDGAWYCYLKSFNFSGLTNGEADYIKGAMVVGVVLGVPEYVRWAVDGPYGIRSMIANNIGRDGTYYETATGYSSYTRVIYLGFAESLLHYRGSAYPSGMNLYEEPKFRSFLKLMNLNTQIGGGVPVYGDGSPIASGWDPTLQPFDKFDFQGLEYLRSRAITGEEKREYGKLVSWMCDGKPESQYGEAFNATWYLFHSKPLTVGGDGGDGDGTGSVLRSRVLGQKGFAFLRAHWGGKQDNQGVFLRYGPSLNHGNFDDLNFSYYALGEDLTYDLGYVLASAHVYTGWTKHTASHQNVVVNEQSQGIGGAPSGGSLEALWDGDFTAAVEASSPGSYENQGVSDYRRVMFLVGDPSGKDGDGRGSYLVDLSVVAGGKKHDSFTHSRGRKMTVGNAVREEKSTGSLAGADVNWGERILVDGDVDGVANKPYWVAPPGNGYGFLMEPERVKPAGKVWWADWELPGSGKHVKVWFPTDGGAENYAAWAPGVSKDFPEASYIVRRRAPGNGESLFVSVWEPYTSASQILDMEVLPVSGGKGSIGMAAIKVKLKDGREDILYWNRHGGEVELEGVKAEGRLARLTLRGARVAFAEGLGMTGFEGAKVAGVITGEIEKVHGRDGLLETRALLPADGRLKGLYMLVNSPAYTRNTAYEIKSVEAFSTGSLVKLEESCDLGIGVVDEVDGAKKEIVSLIGHEYSKPVNKKHESGFFTGKLLVNDRSGKSTRIKGMGYGQPLVIRVEDAAGLVAGDRFHYEDVAAGDGFVIYLPWRMDQVLAGK